MRFDFICGCGHSGTTLLLKMLGQAPQVFTPKRETEIMYSKKGFDKVKEDLISKAREKGCNRIIEKTPRHIHYVDEIRKAFPGAKFVMPVRDGRDVAASIKVRTGNVKHGVNRWVKDNLLVDKYKGDEDVFVYRHEDLVKDPEVVLRKICNFLELEFSPDLLNYHEQQDVWTGVKGDEKGTGQDGKEHNKLRSWQISQPIFDNSGRWKKDLTSDEISLLEEKLYSGEGEKLMRVFGYIE